MTEEQKQEAEKFGGLFKFSKQEIALIVGVPADNPELADAIKIGELKSEAELIEKIFTLAKNGSAEAMKEARKIIREKQKMTY